MREKVVTAVRRQLGGLPEAVRTGPLAIAALAIAYRLDDSQVEDRDVVGLTRELRLLLAAVKEASLSGPRADKVDELTRRRESRRAAR